MVKAFEGHNTKPGPAAVWGLTSQGALPRKASVGICPPGLLAMTAMRDKGRFLERKNSHLTSPGVQKSKI